MFLPPSPISRGVIAWGCLVLLLGSTGCAASRAHIAHTSPDAPLGSRSALLAKQVVADTATEVACYPARTGKNLAIEPLAHLRALSNGVIGKRVALKALPRPEPLDTGAELAPLVTNSSLAGLEECELLPCQVDLYPDGHAALGALEHMIAQAACRIDILMFQWENDSLGAAIANWLAARAGPQVQVRILVDGGGNLMFGEPEKGRRADVNGVVYDLAQHPHVELLRTRNPFARFDHRKLVIVDGKLAWTGGRNFTRESFFEQHDLSFTVTGPLVGEMQACFERFWREQGGSPGESLEPLVLESSNALVHLLHTGPTDHSLANAVYDAIDHARQHIYVENVYLSDSRLIWKLAKARRRGVDVRVVLTPCSNNETTDRSNRVTANRLLQAGIRVYIYPGKIHVKAASVDSCWAYLGTGNFDSLSFRHLREMGLEIRGGSLIQELEGRLFQADFCAQWELHELFQLTWRDYLSELLANLWL